MDKETGKPVENASITDVETGVKTTTDAHGYFQLRADSTINFMIVSVGYRKMQFIQRNANEISSLKIYLDRPANSIKEAAGDDESASFPGGMRGFNDYIYRNRILSSEIKNGKIVGKVIVDFVVDSTGNIAQNEVRVKQELCKPCDDEAIRLIRNSPKWNPGKRRGKSVSQHVVVSIEFR